MTFLTPYTILAAVLGSIALATGGFATGHHWATTKAEAKHAKVLAEQLALVEAEQTRANTLADKLAKAEGRIITRTVEVIRNVPAVTDNAPCLSAAAVGLLNSGSDPATNPSPGQPSSEGSATPPAPGGNAASDRDVAFWIADAQHQYEIAAARLNALIDYHLEGASP